MPSAEHVTEQLAALAQHWRALAMVWHVALAVLLLALAIGWRPSQRLFGVLLALPLASVALLGGWAGNPVNAGVFASTALLLAGCAGRRPSLKVTFVRGPMRAVALLLITFGWLYPHFLADGQAWRYLYAAPLGLLPCPTLAVVVGLTLLVDGLGSRLWSGVVIVVSTLYAVLGLGWLGVPLDAVLLFGALMLAWHRPQGPDTAPVPP